MERKQLKFASRGAPSLLVIRLPLEFSADFDLVDAFCLPVAPRRGGMLLAVPHSVINDDALEAGQAAEGRALLGPSKSLTASLEIENDEGMVAVSDDTCMFLVCDFSDQVINHLRIYDPAVEDASKIIPFLESVPDGLPSMTGIMDMVRQWAEEGDKPRAAFYSAREEPEGKDAGGARKPKKVTNASLMEEVELLKAQLRSMMEEAANQPRASQTYATPAAELLRGTPMRGPQVPPVSEGLDLGGGDPLSGLAHALGPPPTTRAPALRATPKKGPSTHRPEDEPKNILEAPPDPESPNLATALAQQSTAITALVAHLTGQDPMMDLASSSSTMMASGTKGVQRRDRMMSDLALERSQYFLQFQQQLHRRMQPTKPVPTTLEECAASDVSLLTYLERYGGYKQQKELGYVMWLLGHICDAANQGNLHQIREHVALAICAVEQAAKDSGDWNLAFMLALTSDPPAAMFQERMTSMTTSGRAFGPLTPAPWAATALSYMKEMEILTTRKTEVKKQKEEPGAAADRDPTVSPKRRQRFPKKPKQTAE